jgi:hypothetical protein
MGNVTTPDLLSREAVRGLIELEQSPALSIYFPTVRGAVEPEENSLRLKDAIRSARLKLKAFGRRPQSIDAFFDPLETLRDDTGFWRHQTEGLALFRTDRTLEQFRLPFPPEAEASLGHGFHIKPLLPALGTSGYFFILALSQNAIRLLRATRFGAEEVDLTGIDMPRSLADALRYDDLERPDLQSHSGARAGGRSRHDSRGTIFGGRVGSEEHKEQVRRFVKGVDRGLHQVLKARREPLIVACVEYEFPLFKEVTSYRQLLKEHIEGSPDGIHAQALVASARPIVDAHHDSALHHVAEQFGNSQGTGLASSDIAEVTLAALDGRVDSLFARRDDAVWGTADYGARSVTIHDGPGDGSIDLTDTAARATLLNRGRVYVVENDRMPVDASTAALFRY